MTGKRVRDISEFELIRRLRAVLPAEARASADLALGIGDDAAVWRPEPGEAVLVTTDSLIDTVHFHTGWRRAGDYSPRRVPEDFGWTSADHLGWKALAVNISDIAAMGGTPRIATASLALTGHEFVPNLEMLYRGMGEIAVREGVTLAGGDIVRAPHELGIHVTVLGETRNGGRFLSRGGARPGDLIAVTGTLGAAAAGLQIWLTPSDDPRRIAATAEQLLWALSHPEPRVRAGQIALDVGASAAMDLSDGLYGDLDKILGASNVAAVVDLAALPIPAAVRALFPDRFLELATRGGEDYELLLTIPRERFPALEEQIDAIGQTVTAIGEIVRPENRPARLVARGLDGKLHRVYLNERSSIRRFKDPLFLGGAIIVPPVQPGWAKAEVEVMRQAAALNEREDLDATMNKAEAENLAAQIITWANR
jgi:thiamine-monophosphate kinase